MVRVNAFISVIVTYVQLRRVNQNDPAFGSDVGIGSTLPPLPPPPASQCSQFHCVSWRWWDVGASRACRANSTKLQKTCGPRFCSYTVGNKFNPFLFIKNKCLFISSEGFSSLKKILWYVLRRQCCLSSRVWQPAADSNISLAHFFKIWTCWVGCGSLLLTIMVWRASNLKKRKMAMPVTICRGLSHLTKSLSWIVCRGQDRP